MTLPLSSSTFSAFIFDMDGVVIDSEPLHEAAVRAVFGPYGVHVPDAALYAVKGREMREAFVALLDACTDDPAGFDLDALMAAKRTDYQQRLADIALIPGVRPFIEETRRRFAHVALTTSSNRGNQQFVFERFDLHPFFDVVVTAEDITRPKPDPQPYAHTAALLGVPASDCLVIEDSANGVRSAAAAGCTVIGLTTTFPANTLRAAGAHVTTASFAELTAHLFNQVSAAPGR